MFPRLFFLKVSCCNIFAHDRIMGFGNTLNTWLKSKRQEQTDQEL